MIEKQTAYVVLSVKEIRSLLRRAVASQKAARAKSTHCVVIGGIEIDHTLKSSTGDSQISSHDLINLPFIGL